jgi:hypothetical protein
VIAAVLAGGAEAADRLRKLSDDAAANIARAIAKLGLDLQRDVQLDKLGGQLLRARSGSLQSSIRIRVEQNGATTSATVYSDLDYAHAHEYGFSGTVNVRAGLRRVREAFGRTIAERMVSVRGYSRRMDLPERSFLRAALEDMAPQIESEAEAALREAVTK